MRTSQQDASIAPDNWRPARLSTTLAVSVALMATLGLSVVSGDVRPALLGVTAGMCLAATVATVGATERRVAIIAGGLLATVGGLLLLGAFTIPILIQVPWPPVPPLDVLAIAPFITAVAGVTTGFGAVGAVRDLAPITEGLRTALRLPLVAVVPGGAIVLDQQWQLVITGIAILQEFRTHLLEPSLAVSPDSGMVLLRISEVIVLVVVAGTVLNLTLTRLPIVEFASETSQPTVTAARDEIRRVSRRVMVMAILSVPVLLVLIEAPESVPYIDIPPAVPEAIIGVAYASLLRYVLVGGIMICVVSLSITWILRRLSSAELRPGYIPAAPLIVGAILTAIVIAIHEPLATAGVEQAESDVGREFLLTLLAQVGSLTIVLAIVLLALATALTITITLSFGRLVRFVGSNSGPQLIGTGVFLAAIAAAIGGGSVAVVFVGLAASLFVRDLGEYGATLGQEIGRRGQTTQTEIVHGLGGGLFVSLAVGVAVGAVVAVDYLPQTFNLTTTIAMIAASVGTVILFLTTR